MPQDIALNHLAALTVTGRDALQFVHAQVTADTRQWSPGSWYPAGWCDAQGRVLSVMLASIREQEVDIVLPATQLDWLSKRLPMFAIGREVGCRPAGPVVGHLSAGPEDAVLAFDPQRGMSCTASAEGGTSAGARWRAADLAVRFPWLEARTSGRHLPQSLGLEALGGLSHAKGCYPGQEIIARVHFRGRDPYHIATVVFPDVAVLDPATGLVDGDGRRIGELLWGQEADRGFQSLAVVRTDIGDGTPCLAVADSRRWPGSVSL